MSCPTCSKSMECIIAADVFWCATCGTIKQFGVTCVPKLVERCQEFEVGMVKRLFLKHQWEKTGISESIRPQEQRK